MQTRKIRLIFIVAPLITFIISGCSLLLEPEKMYDQEIPLSSTSVFSTYHPKNDRFIYTEIETVDGKKTPCTVTGRCPIAVRVSPGDHSFKIEISTTGFQQIDNPWFTTLMKMDIHIQDMKPSHVYALRYNSTTNKVEVRVMDLGKKPNFGIGLGSYYTTEKLVNFD